MDRVRTGDEVAAHDGQRVVVEGTVTRPTMQVGPGRPWEGTGLRLADGTEVIVSYEHQPPAGWADLVGAKVQVEGTIWRGPPPDGGAALSQPHLTGWTAPVPP